MGKILVTGATGHIGTLTLKSLLDRKVPASELVALVRDPEKAKDLKNLGIELRVGDYMDKPSLDRAFIGVEKVMLVSSQAFTDRKQAHANVIDAAKQSGVKHIVYMPINRNANSDFSMKEVTEEDKFTEDKIKQSGLRYTFLKHPPFIDTLTGFFGPNFLETGIRLPGGNGKIAAATRENLAEAHAAVLTQAGHENRTYTLSGPEALSFTEIAALLSRVYSRDVPLIPVSKEEYIASLQRNDLPDFVANFLFGWVDGMKSGEWAEVTGDLEKLIGHKPTTMADYFARRL